MRGIKCKSGFFFSAINSNYIGSEWKLEEAYYKAQGCEIEEKETLQFSHCNCDHCKTLEHKFEEMIEDIKKA